MSKSKLKRLAIQQAPAPEPTQTNKEAWWAGYRVGKGLPPDTPRHEAVDAPAPEPYGYCVYFPDEQRQEWCNDLDELVDDLTNCRHEITPLYAHPAAPAPSATVDEVMALAHRMKDAAIGWGDVYTAMQTLRAAVEQIVYECTETRKEWRVQHDRAERAESKLSAVERWYGKTAAPAPDADAIMALLDEAEHASDNGYAVDAELLGDVRAAVEQIVSLNTTLAGMVASAEEQRDRQARRAEHAERERDAERDGRDAMDSAARCNHAAYEKERKARLRAEQDGTCQRCGGKGCVAGTFGLLSPNYLHASAATANWDINQIEINGQSESPTDAISNTARDIAHIRAVTKMSVSELSRVFGVSRQAVHEWIKGGALSPRNAQSLSALAQATDTFLEAGIDVTPQVFRRKVAGGPSILEAVRENGNVVELARTLASTLVRESQQRQRLAARLAGRSAPSVPDDNPPVPCPQKFALSECRAAALRKEGK